MGPLPETRRRNWGETSASQSNSVQRTTNRICTLPTQVRFPGTARDFSPRINFQCRLSYGVRTIPCAIAYIYICAHVKDPVVHVRVRWITFTLKHQACTIGWVARLCRSWLSSGKATGLPVGEIPLGQYSSLVGRRRRRRRSN